MRITKPMLLMVAICFWACEDGPAQIFTPNQGQPEAQNGFGERDEWVQDGAEVFETSGGGADNVGRAKFCTEEEITLLVQEMVQQPLIPDASAGGIPLWNAALSPMLADDLLGHPGEDFRVTKKFCDPTGVFSNAYTWGPEYEIIVFFNTETRLVETLQLGPTYLGTMKGAYTKEDGSSVDVFLQMKRPIELGGRKLESYAQWLEPTNISALHRMVRETYFQASPLPDDSDCVADKKCNIFYSDPDNKDTPQQTQMYFQDSGLTLVISPEGDLLYVIIDPVRVAPFEVAAELDFDVVGDGVMTPAFVNPGVCSLPISTPLTWQGFLDACTNEGSQERTLSRADYDVSTMRDSVSVGFNGLTLGFKRDFWGNPEAALLTDGERPGAADEFYHLTFTRSLNAPVAEYVPQTLAMGYKAKLEALLRDVPADHPFVAYTIPEPSLPTEPAPIGELQDATGASWIPAIIDSINNDYQALSEEQQGQLNLDLEHPVTLVHPFVETVLEAFTYGASETAVFKAFRTTDSRKWSIGYSHFTLNGVPYRLTAQYSLYYHALTAVTVEKGVNAVDSLLEDLGEVFAAGPFGAQYTGSYYSLNVARDFTEEEMQGYEDSYGPEYGFLAHSNYSLGGDGIRVRRDLEGWNDRALEALTVSLVIPSTDVGAGTKTLKLKVPGEASEDESGYMKQIRGERYEFVPADQVTLYGKGTMLLFYVHPDGTIGRIVHPQFKAPTLLCSGPSPDLNLNIPYNGDVRQAVTNWAERLDSNRPGDSLTYFRACDVVYNYSENGNVLDSVASMKNKVSFTTVDGKAVTAAIWR